MAIKMFAVRVKSGEEFTKVFKHGLLLQDYLKEEGDAVVVQKLRNVAPFPPPKPYNPVIDDGYV
jgi:hypothetical protein